MTDLPRPLTPTEQVVAMAALRALSDGYEMLPFYMKRVGAQAQALVARVYGIDQVWPPWDCPHREQVLAWAASLDDAQPDCTEAPDAKPTGHM